MSKKHVVNLPVSKPEPSDDLPGSGKGAGRELAIAGYARLERFASVSETELLKRHGVGSRAIRIRCEALGGAGLSTDGNNKPALKGVLS